MQKSYFLISLRVLLCDTSVVILSLFENVNGILHQRSCILFLLPVGSTWLISCRYKRKKPLKLLILFLFVRCDSRLRYAGTLTSGFIAFLISTISIIVRIGLLLLWSGDFHHFQVVINNKHTNEGIKLRFPIIIR